MWWIIVGMQSGSVAADGKGVLLSLDPPGRDAPSHLIVYLPSTPRLIPRRQEENVPVDVTEHVAPQVTQPLDGIRGQFRHR
jgi:hypothetical protein